jgi:Rrf2 family cysteine metabolism transcriptional repressor
MHVSKEVDFALRLVMILARESHSDRDLAEKYRIPHNFVQLILPKLTRAELIRMIPKTKNVYELAKAASEITMLEIATIINGPIDLMSRHYAKTHASDAFFAPMLDVWHEIQEDAQKKLGQVTIASLLK